MDNNIHHETAHIYNGKIDRVNKEFIVDKHGYNKIKSMYNLVLKSFDEHKPSTRHNFLNYRYVIHKLLELEYDDYDYNILPMKNIEKLENEDIIWKKICDDLGWNYYPTLKGG